METLKSFPADFEASLKEENNEEKEGMMTSKENNFEMKKNKFGMLVIEEGDEGVVLICNFK